MTIRKKLKWQIETDLNMLELKINILQEFFNDVFKLIDSAQTLEECQTCKDLLKIVNEYLS